MTLLMKICALVSLSAFSLLPKFARKPGNAKKLRITVGISKGSSASVPLNMGHHTFFFASFFWRLPLDR